MVKRRLFYTATFLFTILVVSVLLLPSLLPLSIDLVKKEQAAMIKEGNYTMFTTIILSEQDLKTCSVSLTKNEMILNGCMYDIVNISKQHNSYRITLLADKRETALQKINASGLKNQAISDHVAQGFCFSFLFFENNTIVKHEIIIAENNYSSTFIIPSFGSPCCSILKPPPDLV